MKVTYDPEARALYLYIKEEKEEPQNSIEVGSSLIIELGKKADVIGIELLGVDKPEIVEIGKEHR